MAGVEAAPQEAAEGGVLWWCDDERNASSKTIQACPPLVDPGGPEIHPGFMRDTMHRDILEAVRGRHESASEAATPHSNLDSDEVFFDSVLGPGSHHPDFLGYFGGVYGSHRADAPQVLAYQRHTDIPKGISRRALDVVVSTVYSTAHMGGQRTTLLSSLMNSVRGEYESQ